MDSRSFSSSLKIADIIPVHKKDSKQDKANKKPERREGTADVAITECRLYRVPEENQFLGERIFAIGFEKKILSLRITFLEDIELP